MRPSLSARGPSRLTVGSMRAAVTIGRSSTSGGYVHSFDRPTSESARPSRTTISVAEGSSETIRTRRD